MRASTDSMRALRARRLAIARAIWSESSSPTMPSSGRSSSSYLPTMRGRSGAPYSTSLANSSRNRALLLDDQDLLEPAAELADDARLHRREHPHLEDADAVAAERRLVEAQLVQGLAHVVVGLARGEDAEPGVRRRHRDAVELVLPRVAARQLEPRVVERPLHVEAVGRDQVDVDRVLVRLPVELDGGNHGPHAVRIDLRRARLVGDVGHDLHRHPEPGDAREHEAVQAEVEDLLHVARVDRRDQRVPERDLGVARQRRGLRDGVVAGEREHAAVLADARVVRVLECVAAAIDAGRLAVPHAQHAVVLRTREEAHHLAAEHRRRREILVQPGREDDVVLGEELRIALEGLVEAAERRPAVARDERRRVEAARPGRRDAGRAAGAPAPGCRTGRHGRARSVYLASSENSSGVVVMQLPPG